MGQFTTPKGTKLPLKDISGKPYLQVAHRILWFREEKPDWSIETEVKRYEKDTLSKATIRNQDGKIVATAHKHETEKGFPDHTEKSETGAIGRALALVGYGTQFAVDLDEGERLADAPLDAGKPVRNDSKPVQRPYSESGAFCENCGSELTLSKSGAGYYCKNFKDTSQGEHTRIKAADLDSFKASQSLEKENGDVPF